MKIKTKSSLRRRVSKAIAEASTLTHVTDHKSLSHHDRFKMSLCRHFVEFAVMKKMQAKEIGQLTGIPKSRLSEMMNYKIDKFTIDQLLKNLTLLAEHDTKVAAYLELLQEVARMPLGESQKSKRLQLKLRQ